MTMTPFEPAVATPAGSTTASERDNALRYTGHEDGHVESHFLKANAPDGSRALWLKHTVLVPRARPEAAVAEVWAVGFVRGAGGTRKLAVKQSYPLAALQSQRSPFILRLPEAELGHGRARGRATSPSARAEWDLRYACPSSGFHPFPSARMYSGPFPRSKTLTPVPSTRMHGVFSIGDQRFAVDGWPAAQGHNWGKSHAHAYAWVHGNVFRDARGVPVDDVWLEALSGRVRVGPLLTPWLSVAAVSIAGQVTRFDGARAMLSRSVEVSARGYALSLAQGDARLVARFRAETSELAGLRYEDPDGSALACLNSKLAHAELELTVGSQRRSYTSDQLALELGTRRTDHGVSMLA